MEDDALRRVEGNRHRLGHRVRDRYELDVAAADRHRFAVGHRNELGVARQTRLVDAVAGQAHRQLGAVNGCADLPQ